MLGRFQRARRKVLGVKPYKAILGDANNYPYAGDGHYWVRPYAAANVNNFATPGTAYRVRVGSAIIVPRGGFVVWIGLGLDLRLTVLGYDHDDLIAKGIDPATVQPNDPYREWIRLKNIQNFRALPIATGTNPNLKVEVRQLFYYTNTGDLVRWNGTNADTHIDLSDYVPVEGFQCYVVLWLRTYNPNGLSDIQVTTSDHIDSVDFVLSFTELQQCADTADADTIPIGAFRLADAQTTLKIDDSVDVDLRQFLNMPHIYGFPNTVTRAYRVHEAFSVIAPSAIVIEAGGVVEVQDNALLLILSEAEESGGGTGTVTSVGLTMPSAVFNVTGSPVTGAGTLAVTFDNQAEITFFKGPGLGGGMGQPTFSSIESGDLGTNLQVDNFAENSSVYASADPTVNDDASVPYLVRCLWLNFTTNQVFECADNTVGAAIWKRLTDPSTTAGQLTYFNGTDTAAFSLTLHNAVIGGGSSNPTTLAPGTSRNVMISDGTDWTSRAITLADLPNLIAILRDEKASGTAGGTSVTTTWNNRDLNTELYDPGSIVSISSNIFTPIAGDYEIWVFTPFLGGSAASSTGKCRLFNVTGGASIEEGMNTLAITNGGGTAMLNCKFTANGSSGYRIDTYTSVGRGTAGLGIAVSDGSAEVYTMVQLRKLA